MALLTWCFPMLLLAGLASAGITPDGDFENSNPDSVNGQELFESDILFTPQQLAMLKSKKAVSSLARRWTLGSDGNPLVPYRYTDADVDQAAIELSIDHWEEHTCIKFETTNSSDTGPHIKFHKGSGCWSYVGMISSWPGQDISIGNGCNYLGIITHEIGHAIGFFHEQSRSDRDDHIRILEEHINQNYINNFNKENDNNYAVPYDIASDMHYSPRAFSTSDKYTIATLNPMLQSVLGQRSGLSHYDKMLANKMYPCIENWLKACNMTSDPCQNNGYTGNDCACVCPPGTSGDNCETVTGDYYDKFISDCSEEITEEGTITSPDYPNHYVPGLMCVKLLKAPVCHRVSLTFNAFQIYKKLNGLCVYDRLEIRTSDLLIGDIYCDNEIQSGQTFVSSSDTMIVNLETRSNFHTGFSADVSFVPIPGCGQFPGLECTEDVVDDNTVRWKSPDFGNADYHNDDSCSITRSSDSPKWARVQFNSFNLESEVNGQCNDYVSFSGISDLEDITVCGSQSGEIQLPSYNFDADFESDSQNTAAGFDITITAEASDCHLLIETGGVGATGDIATPNSANNAWKKKACEWWLRSPPGTKIEVAFNKVKLTRKCFKSGVIIDESGDKSYPVATSNRYCWRQTPKKVTSTDNEINILFFSKNSKKLMQATWTVIAA